MLQGEVFHLVRNGSVCHFCLVLVKLLPLSSGRLDGICSSPPILVILNGSLLAVSRMQNQKCSQFVQLQFGYWGNQTTTGDNWETCAAFGNIPSSVIRCLQRREAWFLPDLLLLWPYKGKKQGNKLQFDLQDLTVAGKRFLDCTSVFSFRLPERGACGLSNSFR